MTRRGLLARVCSAIAALVLPKSKPKTEWVVETTYSKLDDAVLTRAKDRLQAWSELPSTHLYVGKSIVYPAGDGSTQSRVITEYTGTTKVATIDWPSADERWLKLWSDKYVDPRVE